MMCGIGTGIDASSSATLTNGSVAKTNAVGVQRQHASRLSSGADAEVAAVGGVAGERHHPRAAAARAAAPEVFVYALFGSIETMEVIGATSSGRNGAAVRARP